ncbi:MAG TPA: alpha-amylase family glycosyl hydrolase [Solirubrobacteraceae bacterium]|nr:alpha-amylase family glycosyl hydrolase [Solirubrobacteraceae bacterium]
MLASAMPIVHFQYVTGLARSPFTAANLRGSWDGWAPREMQETAQGFAAEVELAPGSYRWGVELERDGTWLWGVMAEVHDLNATAQERSFVLGDEDRAETYWLTQHRRLGARSNGDGIAFTAWAPNAQAVEVVFGGDSGYIADDGFGGGETLPMERIGDGLWRAEAPDFDAFAGRRYMYRVNREGGLPAMRTDMYSLHQIGSGAFNPRGKHYDGAPEDLDGTPSCSVVVAPGEPPPRANGVPRRVEDLVIYELHLGALGFGREGPGTFADATALLPYLSDLGVNAIELLPLFEFSGTLSWGYGSSHFLAIETSAGGRDALKRFVQDCHERGIAVLMDVVYNHYTPEADRAAWQYDSPTDSHNIYLWYEDDPGSYLDNVSSGWAPRYHDEHVRALFVSSAAMLIDELGIDGLRVDQTTSIHAYNVRHSDGQPVGSANVFGRKLLRELCQTLKAIDPDVMLIAEDHSGWDRVTQPATTGGIGFDATWYAAFYHHLIGDGTHGSDYAKLLSTAADWTHPPEPLAMGRFADALRAAANRTVVYVESHDEAGNATASRRTILAAVDGAPLVGETRRVAEARTRWAAGMSLLSPGTPMFLMGEEVGAQQPYTYDRFAEHKEDLEGLRAGSGAGLFRFNADLIRLRLSEPDLRAREIEIVHVNDGGRVIAFRRGDFLVAGSLRDEPYREYGLPVDGAWREIFNSDAAIYGGDDVGNDGATLEGMTIALPANGFVVFRRMSI